MPEAMAESTAEAIRLRAEAVEDPEGVDLDILYELLTDQPLPPAAHSNAVAAVLAVAQHRAIDGRFAEPLVTAMERPALEIDVLALRALREVARDHPDAVLEHLDAVAARVAPDAGVETVAATGCCAELVTAAPTALLDLAPTLEALLDAESRPVRRNAVYVIAIVAEEVPSAVKPTVERLVARLDDTDEEVRTNALSALGRITGAYPSTTVDHVDALGELAGSATGKARANALGLLADVGAGHPEAAATQLAVVIEALDADDEVVRANAVGALIPIAADDPDAVAHSSATLLDRLDDPSSAVRRNACTVLGHLGEPSAADPLRSRRDTDPDERVRELAGWAFTRCT